MELLFKSKFLIGSILILIQISIVLLLTYRYAIIGAKKAVVKGTDNPPAPLGTPTGLTEEDKKAEVEYLKWLIDKRNETYQRKIKTIIAVFRSQIIFVILAMINIFMPNEKIIKIIGIGLELPTHLLSILSPFVLIFLWYRFGYTLANVIRIRTTLMNLYKRVEGLQGIDNPRSDLSQQTFVDLNPFLDSWFSTWGRESYVPLKNQMRYLQMVTLVIYSFLLGAVQAHVYISCLAFWANSNLSVILFLLFSTLISVFFLSTNRAFDDFFGKTHWFINLTMVMAFVIVLVYAWLHYQGFVILAR